MKFFKEDIVVTYIQHSSLVIIMNLKKILIILLFFLSACNYIVLAEGNVNGFVDSNGSPIKMVGIISQEESLAFFRALEATNASTIEEKEGLMIVNSSKEDSAVVLLKIDSFYYLYEETLEGNRLNLSKPAKKIAVIDKNEVDKYLKQ
jgi:hypothetical protein